MSEQQEEIKKQKKQELLEAMATNLELRSDEVQEIMGYIPAWIIRWGITLIFIIICVFLIGSWFFQYPDVIMSQIEVTTENPPAAIMARTNGKIQHLFVKDNHKVKAGEFIGVLETAADYHHLLELKRKLLSLKSLSPRYDESGTLHFSENASLGQLQTPYSTFFKAYSDYRQFLQLDHITKRITALKNQLERRKIVIDTTDRQNTIMTQELELSKNQYKRSETLFNDKIISKNEFDAAKSTYLQKEYSLEGSKSSLASQRIQLSQVKQSIIDLAIEQKERNKQLQLGLDQAYDSLISQIDQWEQNYLLKSPIDGTASYTTIWSINQNVSAGDVVVTVVPENSGHLIGKVVLPMQGSGKVKEGQDVNIKFMSYPHMEYGMVYGRINSKSLVTSDNNYVLEVALPNGLITSYKKKLIFSQNMIGTAEIITDDIRLMERIFTPIKSIIKRMNKRPELEGLEEYDPEAEEKAKKEKAEAEKKKAEEAAAKPETTESSEEK